MVAGVPPHRGPGLGDGPRLRTALVTRLSTGVALCWAPGHMGKAWTGGRGHRLAPLQPPHQEGGPSATGSAGHGSLRLCSRQQSRSGGQRAPWMCFPRTPTCSPHLQPRDERRCHLFQGAVPGHCSPSPWFPPLGSCASSRRLRVGQDPWFRLPGSSMRPPAWAILILQPGLDQLSPAGVFPRGNCDFLSGSETLGPL